jgi:hypothetical protein
MPAIPIMIFAKSLRFMRTSTDLTGLAVPVQIERIKNLSGLYNDRA